MILKIGLSHDPPSGPRFVADVSGNLGQAKKRTQEVPWQG